MNPKKLGRALLFPPIGIMLILLPIATVLLVYSMVLVGTESPIAIISYVLAAYTLTVYSARVPYFIRLARAFKSNNKYLRRYLDDERLRVYISLYVSLIFNTAYAAFQLGLGFFHGSFWFYSLAGYYVSLAVMRLFLLSYTKNRKQGGEMQTELVKYRLCGVIFLVMNLALAFMIFFMVYFDRSFNHHEITTIALAAYTFTSLTVAIVSIIKYRKYNSPVYSAAKAIGLASASVSMLTLESTMLTTFASGTMDIMTRKLLLGFSGGAVSVLVITMAVCMIAVSNRKIKLLNLEEMKK